MLEEIKELVKELAPVALAYLAVLRTRHEVDVLYARARDPELGENGPKMRRRWYSILKRRRRPVKKES